MSKSPGESSNREQHKAFIEKDPIGIAYEAEVLVDRIEDAGVAQSDLLLRLKEANANMTRAITTDHESHGGALMKYAEAFKNVVNSDEFWASLPEYIPPTNEEQEVLKASLEMYSDPANFVQPYDERERLEGLAKTKEALKGVSKESTRVVWRQYLSILMDSRKDYFVDDVPQTMQ